MSSVVPRKFLDLSDRIETGYISPSKAIISYLGLTDGPTDTLIFASVLEQRISESVLNKVIEVVYFVLKHGDFKVGQLPLLGELLVKCSSAEDGNKLHHKVKVCTKTVIGFRKLVYVHIVPEVADLVSKKIRDANSDEYKLKKDYAKEMKKILGKDDAEAGGAMDDAEAGGAMDDAEAGGSMDDVEAGGSNDDAEAGGSKDVAGACGSKDNAEAGGSKKRKI